MRTLLLAAPLIAALSYSTSAMAEDTAEAAVIHAVDEFMRSIKEQDAELMASVTTAEGRTSGLIYQDGVAKFFSETFLEGQARLASGNEATWTESYWDPTILIHNGIAMLWAPYSMEVDGLRVHCGIDVFNLALVNEEWKIVSIQFTAEPDGCPGDADAR